MSLVKPRGYYNGLPVSYWLDLATEKNPRSRTNALLALEQIARQGNDEAIPLLINALNDEDEEVSATAIRILSRLRLDAVPFLKDALAKASPRTRKRAFTALRNISLTGKAEHQAVISALAAVVTLDAKGRQEIDDTFGVFAFGVLGRMTNLTLVRQLHSEDPDRRMSTVADLGKFGGTDPDIAIPALIQALMDVDERVRFQAVQSLGGILLQSKETVDALAVTARQDPSARVRAAAIQTLKGKKGVRN